MDFTVYQLTWESPCYYNESVRLLEDAALPADEFRHADNLRRSNSYLRRVSLSDTVDLDPVCSLQQCRRRERSPDEGMMAHPQG